jgi:hypothetical protein
MKNVAIAFSLGLLGCSQPPPSQPAVEQQALFGLDDNNLTPHTPGPCSIVYRDQAKIAAGADKIWNILFDLPHYSDWNPWVIQASGNMVPGGDVGVTVILNGNQQHADHKVMTVHPYTDFCWKDAGWNAWFVYAQRCRWLTPQTDGTVLYQVELLLDGPFDGLGDLLDGAAMRTGMAAETVALKQRAETP